ncbi:MAG: hypothetical protein WCQ72_04955, partial [Eubacteriales bacterium]
FTTDLMVGFPGESDEDFTDTVDFVRRAKYLHCHIFTYSRRPSTEAAAMKCQIPERIKNERAEYLAGVCTEVKNDLMLTDIGKDFEIVAEMPDITPDGIFVPGHTPNFTEVRAAVSDAEYWQQRRGDIIAVHADMVRDGALICSVKPDSTR